MRGLLSGLRSKRSAPRIEAQHRSWGSTIAIAIKISPGPFDGAKGRRRLPRESIAATEGRWN